MRKGTMTTLLALLAALVLVVTGCSAKMTAEAPRGDYGYGDGAIAPEEEWAEDSGAWESGAWDSDDAPSNTQTAAGTSGQAAQSNKIIYEGKATLEAADPDVAMETLKTQVESMGGYVASSSLDRDEEGVTQYVSMTLKVPAGELDAFEALLSSLGRVSEYQLQSSDITGSYYDVQGRLTNAKAQQKAYLDMMERAETVEEALQVQSALDSIQERIEVLEGQIRRWDHQVALSTLEVYIHPPAVMITEGTGLRLMTGSEFWAGIRKGLNSAFTGTVNFLGWVVIALTYLLIPGLLAGLVALVILLLVRHSRKKRLAARENQAKG